MNPTHDQTHELTDQTEDTAPTYAFTTRLASYTRWIRLDKLRAWQDPRQGKGDVNDLEESFEHTPQLHNIVVRLMPVDGRLSSLRSDRGARSAG